MNNEMMTVKELADYLNLNEKGIYKLLNEKKLPGTKITGKWTFSHDLIRNWIESNSLHNFTGWERPLAPSPVSDLFISGSDDIILRRILSVILMSEAPDILAYFSNNGSMGGLKALRRGKAHIAGMHLYHAGTGLYNTPYIEETFQKEEALLYNLAYRNQGFIMKKNLSVNSVVDIAERKLRYINRERGSGTRLLFKYLCDESGVQTENIVGYKNNAYTHIEVGLTILRGEADIGMGIETVARMMDLDFHPLRKERYDLVVPSKNVVLRPVQIFFNVIHSKRFRQVTKGLTGYDLKDTGTLMPLKPK